MNCPVGRLLSPPLAIALYGEPPLSAKGLLITSYVTRTRQQPAVDAESFGERIFVNVIISETWIFYI
jgi:hypothetical protein